MVDPDATVVPTETKTIEVVNDINIFKPLEEIKVKHLNTHLVEISQTYVLIESLQEEWNLPGSVLESAPFVHLEASVEVAKTIAQTQLDQIEDFIHEEKDTCVSLKS